MGIEFQNVRGHTIAVNGLPRKPVIVDLGAHKGEFSDELGQIIGGSYHLVEANPEYVKILEKKNYEKVYPFAIAANDGEIELNVAVNRQATSILTLPKKSSYDAVKDYSVMVPGRSLNSLLDNGGIKSIDILKIDIEGAEVPALASLSPEMLARIGQITVEFHCDSVFGFDLRNEVRDIIKKMIEMNFAVIDFTFPKKRDVLFINRTCHQISPARFVWLRARCEYGHYPFESYRSGLRLLRGIYGAIKRILRKER